MTLVYAKLPKVTMPIKGGLITIFIEIRHHFIHHIVEMQVNRSLRGSTEIQLIILLACLMALSDFKFSYTGTLSF